ncbi:MAG: bacillithiol biosynthesis cysteine-adding enzyme BshC, partial [Patescibacteria group bacterium]
MSLPLTKIPLSDIPQFSKRDLAYIREEAELKEFYKYPVEVGQFENVIADKAKDQTNREILVQVLKEQYHPLSENEKVNNNIKSLAQNNCYTVITAHQPTIFTGPLYYIYKILSTIKLAEELSKQYPAQQFVPVFVSGAEDHDFEEVQQTLIFGKSITWENEEKGSVGKMSTKSLSSILEQLVALIGDKNEASKMVAIIKKAYQGNATYGSATVELVHELFKKFGLVVLDMSAADLKRAAIPLFKKELLSSPSVGLVEETQQRLNEKGYKAQAMARDINLFYVGDQYRERIVRDGGIFKVLNTQTEFSETEMIAEL